MEDWQENWLELWPIIVHSRRWIGLAGAIALGPILEIGISKGLFQGASGGIFVLIWATIVPLLMVAADRLPFIVWQVAVLSITLDVIVSGLQDHSLPHTYILSAAYSFWAGGTLFSSPLPIYLFLRRFTVRQRYIFGTVIVGLGVLIWLGLKKITG
jgi:hypothetical protein